MDEDDTGAQKKTSYRDTLAGKKSNNTRAEETFEWKEGEIFDDDALQSIVQHGHEEGRGNGIKTTLEE